ncbi:MAG TPA: TonB-dependent receptor [Acidobacteriaceae bacterium]|nr:TonB-dependent receptor [Acidobacteriaceae bacterium]
MRCWLRSLLLGVCVVSCVVEAWGQTVPVQGTGSVPVRTSDSVTVSADRGLVGVSDSATSVAVVSGQQMQAEPGLTLDDRLHEVAGFQLFRRTSSWTANPTTEGVSLRGLGSTAASRTLVVSEQVPLNDAFGGWVHWDEIPSLGIEQVRLLRGGAADLYGSSAIGGVVDVVPVMPVPRGLVVKADVGGGTENSVFENGLVSGAMRRMAMLAAYSGLRTDGYIPTAPEFRGTVDVPANVHAESGRVVLSTVATKSVRGFLLGNVLNEARGNGTPLQTNGTRLWRYVGGADAEGGWGTGALRLYGSREAYRQSFSAIAADRDSEVLTKLQHVPVDEMGVVAQAAKTVGTVTGALGVDVRDVRATDDESAVVGGEVASTTSTSARQREVGGYADAIWLPKGWSVSGSVRVDSFRTFDARRVVSTSGAVTALPELDELMVSPRLGVVKTLGHGFLLTGTGFRAFRGPTMNELYRTGQVGQQTTLANASLLAERATGFEFGGEVGGKVGRLRATYFWTEVNRPISAVELSQTATTQLLQRQNLGQIRSRGAMVEGQTATWRGLDASFGYQYAVATVTAFNSSSPAQANLTGNWIPEVPRQSVTGVVNYVWPKVATFHGFGSYEGKAFDDAANEYVLRPYARVDVSAERGLGRGFSVYAGAQNLLNRTIDAGLTPVLTLAAPRLVLGGVRYAWGRQ